ncbi:hypothetical protein [Paenibacillus alvei]|uniref:hypothetical protein n=1 Tax=Paenibacillus alvei TaxID=44250 RepID=UPI0003862415|nr:hypothetical protein [Paenibacillus alvei]EPY12569.1 hypothetical protein PAAL66ix_12677 [Paenibacillus alvei A6-6i-x]
MPYEAKTNWKYDDTVTEKDLNRIEQGLKDAHVAEYKDITLKPGVQIVDVPEDTPFRMGEIRGRTLINLLGGSKRFSNVVGVSVSYDDKGITITGSESTKTEHYTDSEVRFTIPDVNGYYLAAAEVTATKGKGLIRIYGTGNGLDVRGGATIEGVSYAPFKAPSVAEVIIRLQIVNDAEEVIFVQNGEKVTFTKVRLYQITESEYTAIKSMTAEQVAKLYPYVDSMTNVTNPYAIATSGNLLPPFTEWVLSPTDSIVSSYKLDKVATNQYDATISPKIRVVRGQTYTLSSIRNGRMVLGEYKEDGTVLRYLIAEEKDNNGYFYKTVTISSDTDYVIVQLSNMANSGSFSFKNPMLTLTAEPQPFTPMNRSMWAAECQLAANPVDGTNEDVLYVGDDGLPYVLKKWEKVTLDGSLSWAAMGDYPGGMTVYVKNLPSTLRDTGFVTKYDGSVLERVLQHAPITKNDQQVVTDATDYFPNSILIAVSSKDSGWGDKYTPTTDEIKAYFLGWKMFKFGDASNAPYNGEGEKDWAYRQVDGTLGGGGNKSVPTTMAPINSQWQPYRLQYLKSKPTVEPVSNYETGLTLSKGWNVVEVGSGVVIREKADVHIGDQTTVFINAVSAGNRLKRKTVNILSVFTNRVQDSNWSISTYTYNGETYAYASNIGNYDSTAVYHATYTMLDPTLAAPINGSIAANMRGSVTDVVHWASDAERRLSVVEKQKAEKDLSKPVYIKPTLLNGWNRINDRSHYFKQGNRVFVYIAIWGGTKTKGTTLMKLPYKPSAPSNLDIPASTFDSESECIPLVLLFEKDGALNIGASNQEVSKRYLTAYFSYETND